MGSPGWQLPETKRGTFPTRDKDGEERMGASGEGDGNSGEGGRRWWWPVLWRGRQQEDAVIQGCIKEEEILSSITLEYRSRSRRRNQKSWNPHKPLPWGLTRCSCTFWTGCSSRFASHQVWRLSTDDWLCYYCLVLTFPFLFYFLFILYIYVLSNIMTLPTYCSTPLDEDSSPDLSVLDLVCFWCVQRALFSGLLTPILPFLLRCTNCVRGGRLSAQLLSN